VRQALAGAVPPSRKTPERTSPRLAQFQAAIDAMLRGDLDGPKKQRHTARRVLARRVDEHGAADLSYSTGSPTPGGTKTRDNPTLDPAQPMSRMAEAGSA